MVDVDKAVIAQLKSHGHTFEILVDCDNAIAFKGGKDISLNDIVATKSIYSDAKKGLEVGEGELNAAFSTTDVDEIIPRIIKKGDIQLTSEYRAKLKEQKRKQIINIIHRNGVDPKTHAPHPPGRIEDALAEAKFHTDEFKDVNEQVQDALKKIRAILPIKFEIKEIQVKITPEYAPKCYQVVKNLGTLIKEEWLPSGYWQAVLEIPGGLEAEMYEKLNKLTHGNAEINLLKTK